MKRRLAVVAALLSLALAAVASTAGVGAAATDASQAVSCKRTLRMAIMTPLTGDAGFLGNEQLTWAQHAVKTLAPKFGLKIQLLKGDTQLDAALASSLAQKYVADQRVVAIIGPATSGAVAATSKTLFDAGLAHISPSATRTALTKGANRQATAGFFRVVPDDGIQGPSDARYMIEKLNAKKVVLIDAREPYSVGLADATQAFLRGKGVTTIRESVTVDQSDFSSLVTKIPNDTDVVFIPWQQPPKAQTFAQQMAEQGKRAKIFGADGTNDPDKFKFPGALVSNFAADISAFAYNKAVIAAWQKENPNEKLGSFGPPAYAAVQVALNAIKRACNKGKGQILDRRDVIRNVKRIRIQNFILGGTFRFSTKTNDPLNGQFYIFEIQRDGKYKLVS